MWCKPLAPGTLKSFAFHSRPINDAQLNSNTKKNYIERTERWEMLSRTNRHALRICNSASVTSVCLFFLFLFSTNCKSIYGITHIHITQSTQPTTNHFIQKNRNMRWKATSSPTTKRWCIKSQNNKINRRASKRKKEKKNCCARHNAT